MTAPTVICQGCGQTIPPALTRPFRLDVSGWPTLYDAAGNLVVVRTRKQIALLVRLAMEDGRTFTRPYLQELLWSDVNDERLASHSLSQALSVFKAILGPGAIAMPRGAVRLVHGVIVVHDSGEWPFLDGFELREAPAFEDWIESRRVALAVR